MRLDFILALIIGLGGLFAYCVVEWRINQRPCPECRFRVSVDTPDRHCPRCGAAFAERSGE
jgi:hypothetical protein